MTSTSPLTYAADLLRKQLAQHGRAALASRATFVLFVVTIFFAKGGKAPGLAISPIIIGAILAFSRGMAGEVFGRLWWFWGFLGFLAVWTVAGAMMGRAGYDAEDISSIALLGCLLLFTAQASQTLETRQILRIIAVVGALSAFFSIVVHVLRAPDITDRLIPLGRAGNPIPGAGGLAVALIATLALWRERGPAKGKALLGALALAVPLVAAIVWTQSRAPIIALCAALLAGLLLHRRGMVAVLGACAAIWLIIAGLIMFEQPVKELICSGRITWCRPSYRPEVWEWVQRQIALHPIMGSGPSFRFQTQWTSHPHNGLLGMAMYYGLVVLAVFILIVAAYAKRLVRQPDATLRLFGLACLIFSFGYMGADLSNPFAFFNTHYLFMWFPIFLVLTSEGAPPAAREGLAPDTVGMDGLRRV
jgi:hypothetical protein